MTEPHHGLLDGYTAYLAAHHAAECGRAGYVTARGRAYLDGYTAGRDDEQAEREHGIFAALATVRLDAEYDGGDPLAPRPDRATAAVCAELATTESDWLRCNCESVDCSHVHAAGACRGNAAATGSACWSSPARMMWVGAVCADCAVRLRAGDGARYLV